MPLEGGWLNFTRRLFQLFKSGEVKTPLSFLFRVLWVFSALLLFILYAPTPPDVNPDFKLHVINITFGTIVLLCVFVAVFAWFRPKNLVYGETGHRAEYRMDFGTEKKTVTQGELEQLTPTDDKTRLPGK